MRVETLLIVPLLNRAYSTHKTLILSGDPIKIDFSRVKVTSVFTKVITQSEPILLFNQNYNSEPRLVLNVTPHVRPRMNRI